MSIPSARLEDFAQRLREAARPMIFYDDDADGLCSFLLCARSNVDAIGIRAARGPELGDDFLRNVAERDPDLIVILDKPRVSPTFIRGVSTPTIWIDHHDLEAQHPETWDLPHMTYLNPRIEAAEDRRPVTYWMHVALGGPTWLAAAGTLSDWDTSLLGKLHEEMPSLCGASGSAEEALYEQPVGVLVRMLNFLLKGRSKQIATNVRVLRKVDSPVELLEGNTPRGRYLRRQYAPIAAAYEQQLALAMQASTSEGMLVHVFGHVSISLLAEISNELMVRKTDAAIILVGRREGGQVKFSIRSATIDLRPLVRAGLDGVLGHGGGHKEACGGAVEERQFDRFLAQFKDAIP